MNSHFSFESIRCEEPNKEFHRINSIKFPLELTDCSRYESLKRKMTMCQNEEFLLCTPKSNERTTQSSCCVAPVPIKRVRLLSKNESNSILMPFLPEMKEASYITKRKLALKFRRRDPGAEYGDDNFSSLSSTSALCLSPNCVTNPLPSSPPLLLKKKPSLSSIMYVSDDEDDSYDDDDDNDTQFDMNDLSRLALPDLSPRLEEYDDNFNINRKFINLSMRRYSTIQEDLTNLF